MTAPSLRLLHASPERPAPGEDAGAAALAMLLAGLLLAAGLWVAQRLERRDFPAIIPVLGHSRSAAENDAPEVTALEQLKNQGRSLQHTALAQPNLLPLYGSSEITRSRDDKASIFFRQSPTGFAVFPVGRAGATSLILAQKIAAAAPTEAGHPVAISLSPSWFTTGIFPRNYSGNFSSAQALATLLNPRLSFGLKRALAQRMLAFPETLAEEPLLAYLAAHLAGKTPADRLLYEAARPLGAMEQEIQELQEQFQLAVCLVTGRHSWSAAPPRTPAALNWPRLLAEADTESTHYTLKTGSHRRLSGQETFLEALRTNAEWTDLQLLLRTLRELHLRPLLLSMPLNGPYLREDGLSSSALAEYPHRLRALAARYGVPVATFEEHLDETNFLVDVHDHLSRKGWMYYNQALDRFMHTPPSATP